MTRHPAVPERAAAEPATWAGELLTAGRAAACLGIRRCDLGHLVRAGLLAPARWVHGPYDSRRRASVPLYRRGDLARLCVREDIDIDWAAVRSAAPRSRSVLAGLPDHHDTRSTP